MNPKTKCKHGCNYAILELKKTGHYDINTTTILPLKTIMK